jgi:hypothetical protein
MLVRFESDVGGITMFGDDAVKLLKMMGHSGTVPSAILAEDVPQALARLKAAVEGAGGEAGQREPGPSTEDERETSVPLRRRAHPLIELLSRAAGLGCDVTWR